MTHHIPVRISRDSDTFAICAYKRATDLILFVHGYRGDAVTTWLDFPRLLLSTSDLSAYDIVSWGYPSTEFRADASAHELTDFLVNLAVGPMTSTLNDALPPQFRRGGGPHYQSITVVAHSLGAAVVRLALLKAAKRGLDFVRRVRLVLYAPAHLGADILELLRQSLLGPLVLPLWRMRHPTLIDLEKGSLLMNQLAKDTQEQIARVGLQPHLVAKAVIQAPRDNVVPHARFCSDPEPMYVEAHRSHRSVCKPSFTSTLPFDVFLSAIIQR